MSLDKKLLKDKQDKIAQGLFRKVSLLPNTNDFYNFSSNDYLSLTRDLKVNGFYKDGYNKYATGSTGSIVISGYTSAHADLENYLSSMFNVDSCVLYSSGYLANLSVVSLLAKLKATILIDKSVHASIYDGIKLNNISYDRYLHNNLDSLQKKLDCYSKHDLAVFTESVFSMSGQTADLAQINKLLKITNTALIVDEAHAFGVIGNQGLGAVVEAKLSQDDVPLRIIPLGKAGAGYGAVVLGKKLWIESLLQTRQSIYSTAVSPAVAYGLLRTMDYIRTLDDRRKKLQDLISYFRVLQSNSHLKWRDSKTHIQQLQLGCPHLATKICEELFNLGIICLPIREPTVTRMETGLRIILNYHHEAEHLDYLFSCLSKFNYD